MLVAVLVAELVTEGVGTVVSAGSSVLGLHESVKVPIATTDSRLSRSDTLRSVMFEAFPVQVVLATNQPPSAPARNPPGSREPAAELAATTVSPCPSSSWEPD